MYEHEREQRKAGPVKGPALRLPIPSTWSRDWWDMEQYLMQRDLDYILATQCGWYPTLDSDDYVVRIVIPAESQKGLAYWQARDTTGKARLRYKSPPGSRGDALVVIHRPVNHRRFVALCEGPMDALALIGTRRIDTAIAMMGVQPPGEVWNHALSIVRVYETAVIMADSDALDLTRAWLPKIASACASLKFAVPFPPYKDFAAMPASTRLSFIERVL